MNFHPFIAVAAAVALTFSASAERPRDGGGQAPPPVVSQKVSIRRGESVTIPLGIHGVRGGALEFLIRTPPRFGRLSGIKPMGLNSASVIYTAPTKGAATEDQFAYAVRSNEGVSAPGLVSIAIAEPVVIAARLVAPAELAFPAVFCGQRSTVELELANRGAGFVEGELNVPEPWSVEGIRLYKLVAGKSAMFSVVFKSDKPGKFSGDIILPGPPRTVISLSATAEERLVANPLRVELAAQPGSLTRMAVFRLSNRSDEDAKVMIAASPRLMTDRAVTVPARSEVGVPVFADAGEMTAIEEDVKLTAGEWSAKVAVHARAVGAVLQFVKSDRLFTAAVSGKTEEGTAVLENFGGKEASVRLAIARPFALSSETATVPAKGRLEIPIRLAEPEAGTHAATLTAAAEGQTARLEIRAEVAEAPKFAPQTASRPEESPAPRIPAEDDAKDTNTTSAEDNALLPSGVPEIPNILGTHVADIRPVSAVIDWTPDLGKPADLHFEERVLSISSDDELQVKWVRCTTAPRAPEAGRIRVEVTGLAPKTFHVIRAISGEGGTAATVFTVQFHTPEKKPFVEIEPRPVALTVAIALLGFLSWRRWKQRRRA